jgi:hypothetical protein
MKAERSTYKLDCNFTDHGPVVERSKILVPTDATRSPIMWKEAQVIITKRGKEERYDLAVLADTIESSDVMRPSEIMSMQPDWIPKGYSLQEAREIMKNEVKILTGDNHSTLVKILEDFGLHEESAYLIENAMNLYSSDHGRVESITSSTLSREVVGVQVREEDKWMDLVGKISANSNMLRKGKQFMLDAWEEPLLRAIIPKFFGLFEENEVGVLLSYHTNQLSVVDTKDLQDYFDLQERCFTGLEKSGIKLQKNPLVNDIFNTALLLTYMKPHRDSDVYVSETLDSVSPVEMFDSLLCNASNGEAAEIARFFPLYQSLFEEASEFDSNKEDLVHYDLRPENRFTTPYGFKAIGDFDFVKPGTVEFDLAKFEVPSLDEPIEMFCHMRNFLEQDLGNDFEYSTRDIEELKRKAKIIGFMNAVKLASYKAARNTSGVRSYINLANAYLPQIH